MNITMKRRNEQGSIAELFAAFSIEKKVQGVKYIHEYEETVDRFLKDNNLDWNDSVQSVNKEMYYRWIEGLMDRGLAVASVNFHISNTRVFFNWCMKQGELDTFKISNVKGQEPTLKIYSDEEIEVLTRKPKGNYSFIESRTYTAICFMMATGARAGTLVNIGTDDLDLVHNEVTYRHLKTRGTAVIPVSPSLEKVLREYLNEWDLSECKYLFPDAQGNQLTTKALYLAVRKYCKKRGVECKGVHAFRHTFARGWIKNNGNPMVLQKILCHSTLDMTKHYIALFSDDLKKDYGMYSPLDSIISTNRIKKL